MKRKMQAHKKSSASGLLGLRVVVVPDEDAFFAQGFDVDYFASGATAQEAEENFKTGLEKMVEVHMEKFGNLDRLKPAPPSVRAQYARMQFTRTDAEDFQGVKKMAPQFLYEKLLYLSL